jgi:hypothetical protein
MREQQEPGSAFPGARGPQGIPPVAARQHFRLEADLQQFLNDDGAAEIDPLFSVRTAVDVDQPLEQAQHLYPLCTQPIMEFVNHDIHPVHPSGLTPAAP